MNYLCLSDKKMKTILIPTFKIKLVDKKSSPIISQVLGTSTHEPSNVFH